MRLAFCTAVLLSLSTAANACERLRDFQFASGTSAGEIQGAVARGETACFVLRARAGQTMDVRLTAPERNAVLQAYEPGWRRTRLDGLTEIEGKPLPGTEQGQDARAWSGQLPSNGAYLLVIGATRGGAEYRLNLAIR